MAKPMLIDEEEFRNFHIFSVKVNVYQPPDKPESEILGELLIDFSYTAYRAEMKTIRLPLLSAWVCNTKPTVQTVCKAHAALPNWKKLNKAGTLPHEVAKLQRLMAWIYKRRGFPYHTKPSMRLSLDDRFTVLRYGYEDNLIPFPAPLPGGNNWESIPIFDSKSIALQEIFRVISKYSKTVITGVDLIDLNKVSDSVLEEIGFVKVPDVLGQGVSMWQGDAERIATLGKSSFRSGYSRYSSSYKDHRAEASAATQEVINSFLDILEAELSVGI